MFVIGLEAGLLPHVRQPGAGERGRGVLRAVAGSREIRVAVGRLIEIMQHGGNVPSVSEPEPDEAEERWRRYVALSRWQVPLYLTCCRTRRLAVDGEPGRPEPRRASRDLRGLRADLDERAA